MSSTTAPSTALTATTPPATGQTSWDRTLLALTAVTVTADVAVQLIIGPIPPLIVFALLGVGGIALLRVRPRAGRIMLLVVAALGAVAAAPFAIPSLPHPESPIDFLHAVTSLPLRLATVGAGVAAVRGATHGAARTLGVTLAGLGALAVVSVGAGLLGGGDVELRADDVVLRTDDATFVSGNDLVLPAGQRLVIDNADPLRHTFTIDAEVVAGAGSPVNIEVPALATVAADIELSPGEYAYHCAVPGHESMTGTLTIQG